MACWLFAAQKDGMSALSLQRSLEIGSYPTAWAMLHRLRSVLVRPGRDRLTGTVEVDETYIGGEEPGLRGGRAKGKKSLVGVAVEVKEPRGYGRARMAILADASAASLHPFVTEHVEPGTTRHHRRLAGLPRHRQARVHPRAAQPARGPCPRGGPGELLPAVHRVASLAKRWLLGTHQGSVERRTCRATSTSSSSASTAVDRAAEAWSSTACSNSPSRTLRCAIATWSPTRSRREHGPHHRGDGATHRALDRPRAAQPWRGS